MILTRSLTVALTIVTAVAVVQSWRLRGEQLASAQQAQRHAAALTAAVQAARDEEQRRVSALQEVADEARKREEQARADADAARSAGERLRAALATARAAICHNPASAGAGSSTDATERVLADVQRRLDEAQDRVARFADEAHTSGLACQQSYDALSRREAE
jgi:hypothetical protein